MSNGPRRATSTNRNRKIAGGILAAAVAAGTAYAVPSTAEAAPQRAATTASDGGHHLSPRLSALVSGNPAGAASGPQLSLPQTGGGSLLRTPDGQRVVVDLRLSSRDDATIHALKAAGARLLPQAEGYGRVAVSVLPQDLMAVGDVPGVLYVGEELTPQVNATCDTTISAGDSILKADQLRATGVDGTGVRVGVLSDSYDQATGVTTDAAADIASDNLPGAANTCGHTSVSTVTDAGSGEDEGRAMMQIVHDLAPGAALDFATAFISEASFAINITQLANQGAKVIVDDVTYFDEPMYQDGIVEQAVTGVRAAGVDYFSSSANNRMVKNGHEVGSYEAVTGYRPTACPAIAAITNGHTDCHNFSAAGADPTFGFGYTANQPIVPILNWAEAWDGGVHTDLDMYLINTTSNTVIGTNNSQVDNLASQQAFEFFGGSLGANLNLAIVVARKSNVAPAATPRFKIVWAENGANPFSSLEREVPDAGSGDVMGPTAFGHNGGADTMSVGASDVRVATNLNSYSSYGPVTTLFGPVNGSTPAAPLSTPRVVNKPDIVASDCNLTTFFFGGGHTFCGTSAAAPHAAAVAALLMQKFPTASAAAINTAMTTTATPIAGVPASFQGGGLLNALAAGSAVVVPPPPPPAAPNTIITKAPKKTIRTTKRKVKVSFAFTSTIAGSTFACRMDGKAFTPCTSGVTYKLKVGKHIFAVRATAAGVTDPTPATYTFKIKRKRHHH